MRITLNILDSVYYPGDTLRCKIDFTNDNDKTYESLLYSYAQIHGQYTLNSECFKLLNVEQNKQSIPLSKLPVLNNGGIIFYSPEDVVACDITLSPLETKSFIYTCTIPTDPIPPSYIGKNIKYKYMLTFVAIKSVMEGPNPLIRVPFKVLNPLSGFTMNKFTYGCPNFKYKTISKEMNISDESILEWNERKIHPSIEYKLNHYIKPIIEKYSKPISVNIRKGSHHLVKITLDKSSFFLGETMQVHFDFTNSTLKCFQIGSFIETEEEILIENANKKFTRIVSEFHEATANILSTCVDFNIPIDKSTQNFESDLAKLKWQLRFEFIVSKEPMIQQENQIDLHNKSTVDKVHWKIPLFVYSSHSRYKLIDSSSSIYKNVLII